LAGIGLPPFVCAADDVADAGPPRSCGPRAKRHCTQATVLDVECLAVAEARPRLCITLGVLHLLQMSYVTQSARGWSYTLESQRAHPWNDARRHSNASVLVSRLRTA